MTLTKIIEFQKGISKSNFKGKSQNQKSQNQNLKELSKSIFKGTFNIDFERKIQVRILKEISKSNFKRKCQNRNLKGNFNIEF